MGEEVKAGTQLCQDFLICPAGWDITPSSALVQGCGYHIPHSSSSSPNPLVWFLQTPSPQNNSQPSALFSTWQSQALVREEKEQEEKQFGQFCIVCTYVGGEESKSVGDTKGIYIWLWNTGCDSGSRSSRFTFLISPIFKWIGTPWMHATKLIRLWKKKSDDRFSF